MASKKRKEQKTDQRRSFEDLISPGIKIGPKMHLGAARNETRGYFTAFKFTPGKISENVELCVGPKPESDARCTNVFYCVYDSKALGNFGSV